MANVIMSDNKAGMGGSMQLNNSNVSVINIIMTNNVANSVR